MVHPANIGHTAPVTPPALEAVDGATGSDHNILGQKQAHAILDTEFAAARQEGSPISVITADLNALKAVNDEMSHDDGNILLGVVEEVLEVVEDTLRLEEGDDGRPADIISVSKINYAPFKELRGMAKKASAGRVGGDEFLITLPDTDEAGALVVADRIREVVREHLSGPHGDGYRKRGINVGLAMGTATVQPEMENSSDLLRLADKRMYRDKMGQVQPLSEEQIEHFILGLKHISAANVRPRDIPRTIEWLGEQGVKDILELDLTGVELTEKLF
jgi:GGDEF domain-containing protein